MPAVEAALRVPGRWLWLLPASAAAAGALGYAAVVCRPVGFALLGLLAAALLVLFFLRPFYLLLVFLVTIPVSYQFEISGIGTILKPIGFLLIVCSIPTLLARCADLVVRIRNTGWWMIGLVGAAFLSLFSFVDCGPSLAGFVFVVGDCLFYFVCVALLDSKKKVGWAVGALVVAFVASSLLALFQKFVLQVFRVEGSFTDPNYFALGILPLLFIVLHLFWQQRWSWLKALLGAALAALLMTVPLTLSRSGLISLVLVLVVSCIRAKKIRYLFVIGAATVAAALFFLPPWLLEGFSWQSLTSSTRLMSLQFRQGILMAGVEMFLDHPLIGVGVDNFRQIFHSYSTIPPLFTEAYAHNTYLEIAVGMGLAGLVPLLGIVFSSLANVRRAAARFGAAGDRFHCILAEGVLMGLFAYLVDVFFLSAQHDKLMWFLFALATALVGIAPGAGRPVAGPGPDRTVAPTR